MLTNENVCVHVCTCGLWHKHAFLEITQKHFIAAPAVGDIWCTLLSISMLLYWSRHMDEWCIPYMLRCIVWRSTGSLNVLFCHLTFLTPGFKVKADLPALSAEEQRLGHGEERVCLPFWCTEPSLLSWVFTSLSQRPFFFILDIDDIADEIDMFKNETLLQLSSVKTFQSCLLY